MLRFRLLPLLSVVVFASCVEPDSVLRVDVTVKTVDGVRVRADCLRIQVLDDASAELDQSVFARPSDDTAVIAIRRGDKYPRSIGLRVQGLQGTCTDEATLKLNAQSDVVKADFPERGFSTVLIELGPPGAALDGDRDGWVDFNKGGPDCDDSDRTIFPGATQVCAVQKDTDCDGFIGCDDSECTSAMVCANPPTRLAMIESPAPLEMSRHECIGPFRAQLFNDSGVRTAIRVTPVTISSSLPGLTFHPSCTDASTDFSIPYGQSEVRFYARADGAVRGTANVSVRGERVPTSADFPLKVKALPFASIRITSPERTVTAGVCSTETIDFELLDAQGRHTDADENAVIFNLNATLNGSGVSDLLYADTTCAAVSPALTFAPGVGNLSVRVSNVRAAEYQVTAVNGATQATQKTTVVAAAPSKLQLLNNFLVLTPMVCSNGGFGVELLDMFGNRAPAPAGAMLTVEPEQPIPTVTFHSGIDCVTPDTSTVEFPAGQTTRFIPTRGSMTGTGRVRVSMPGVATTDWLNVSVGVGALTYFDLFGTAQTIVANGCSTGPMVFVARDNAGNPTIVPDGGVTIAIASTDPGVDLRFFTNSTCAPGTGRPDVFIPAGGADLRVYFSGTRARPPFDFSGSSMAYPVDGGVLDNVIRADVPFHMAVAPGVANTTAGSCVGFKAALTDAWNNPAVFDAGRSFAVTPGSLTVSPNGACSNAGVMVPPGEPEFDFFVGANVAGTYDFTAVAATALPANARLIVDAGQPLLFATPGSATRRAGECLDISVTRRDALMNATPVTMNTNFAVTAGPRTWVFGSAGCSGAVDAGVTMTTGNNTATFSVRPIAAETQNVVIAAGAGNDPQVVLTVNPNVTARLEFVDAGVPLQLTAGECSAPLSVRRFDAWGNLATTGSETVALSSMNLVQFSLSCMGPAVTDTQIAANQSLSSPPFFVRGTSADAGVLRADFGSASGTLQVAVSPAAADHLSFVNAGTTTPAGTCTPARVELRDRFENRVIPGSVVTVTLGSDGGVPLDANGLFFSDLNCATPGPTLQLTSGTPSVDFRFRTIRAAPANAPMLLTASTTSPVTSTAAQTWAVTPLGVGALRWKEAPPASLTRFECSRLGPVETRDIYGNLTTPTATLGLLAPLVDANLGAQFFGDSSCMTAAPASIAAGASDSAAYFVVANGADAGTITARSGAIVSDALPVTVGGALGTLTISDAGFVEASACWPVTVTRVDGSGTPVTRGETQFSIASANGSIISLHATPDCSGAGGTQAGAFMAGQSSVTFWVRGRSSDGAVPVAVTVTDVLRGSNGSSTNAISLPLVRRGTCDVVNGTTSSRCELTPPLPNNDISRSFLLFSSTGGDNSASLTNLSCKLDSTADASVVCTRAGSGATALQVEYQVVSYGRGFDAGGVSVQHLGGTTDSSGNFVAPLNGTAPMGESFVLFSTNATGSENGADDFITTQLEAGTSLRMQAAAGAAVNYEAQVVSFSGAQVTRGATGLDAGVFSVQVAGIPSGDVPRAFLLYSVRGGDLADGGVSEMCKRRVRGGFDGGAIFFNRGVNNDASCAVDAVQIQWEAVRLPSNPEQRSQQVQGGINGSGNGNANQSNNFSFASVVLNRSVGFMGGQGPGGQSMGESNFFVGNEDATGPFHALLKLTSGTGGTLECRNPRGGNSSQFNPFVVQFAP